jgi:nucleoid DNA-binding protein
MYITTGDLIRRVQKDFPHIKNEVVKAGVEVIFEEILKGLEQHKPVLLTRFGAFLIKKRKNSPPNLPEYKGMEIKPYTYAIVLKFSKKVKRKVNDAL